MYKVDLFKDLQANWLNFGDLMEDCDGGNMVVQITAFSDRDRNKTAASVIIQQKKDLLDVVFVGI